VNRDASSGSSEIKNVHASEYPGIIPGLCSSPFWWYLMPDTNGVNFYTVDPDLTFLLCRYLTVEDHHRAQALLTAMGAVASQRMDELAEIANREGPILKHLLHISTRW
jgi:hypothetical protein